MTEKKAKRELRRMLDDFTTGTLLHFLDDLFRDDLAAGQCQRAEATLFVVGMGIDAARPR